MSGGTLQAKQPIPVSLIKGSIVSYAGMSSLIADGKLARTNEHSVYFSMDISPHGKEIKNPRVFWSGPICKIKATESDIFKGGLETISFTWEVDPMQVVFVQNQFVSAWGDGEEWIKKGYMQMSPPEQTQTFLANPKRKFCFRYAVTANSYDQFHVVLESVPTTPEVLKGCPWAESLVTGGCEIDRWEATPGQALPDNYGPGILPFLQDDRQAKYQKEYLLPSSEAIRHMMWQTVSSMGVSADFEEDDWDNYNPNKTRRPPVLPDIPQVEDVRKGVKRKSDDQPPPQVVENGNAARIKELLGGKNAGEFLTPDERKALGWREDEEDDSSPSPKRSRTIEYDTPQSLGLDVSSYMAKLPPGLSRERVAKMTFKAIETAIKLSEGMGIEERAEAAYNSATATRMIPAHEDNRMDILHPARHFPASLAEPKKYWAQVPLRIEPHVPGIPLTHVGMENTVAPLAILKAGDRSIRLFIRYFMQANVNVQQKAPKFQTHTGESGSVGFTSEENWKEASKVSQIKDAVFHYMFIMADLHRDDYGPRNLLRLMDKMDWLSFRHDQLFALKQVIDGVLGRYHYLAVQKKPPLSYKELQEFVTATLGGIGVGLTKAPDTLPPVKREREDFRGSGGGGRGRGRSTPAATAVSSPRETPPTCFNYNSPAGCPRAPAARMCYLKSGKTLLHLCNQTNGKGDVCLEAHPKPEHK